MSELKISNFHTHTQLCGHAEGLPVDYVKQAMKDGCCELGISDHCPYPDSLGPQWDVCRMNKSQLDFYASEVKKASLMADFKVHLGFECEYDRNYINWYKDELLGRVGAEYLVFGPHWCTVGKEHPYAPEFNHDKKLLFRYTDQVIEGIQTGMYAFIAHPDLFMMGWKNWDDESSSCLNAILQAAKDQNLPVEINGLGIHRGLIKTERGDRYGYPYHEFWELVSRSQVRVICNSDAHLPEHVIMNARRSREFAGKYGIVPVETIF